MNAHDDQYPLRHQAIECSNPDFAARLLLLAAAALHMSWRSLSCQKSICGYCLLAGIPILHVVPWSKAIKSLMQRLPTKAVCKFFRLRHTRQMTKHLNIRDDGL
jgi:hypothetical protein